MFVESIGKKNHSMDACVNTRDERQATKMKEKEKEKERENHRRRENEQEKRGERERKRLTLFNSRRNLSTQKKCKSD